MEDSVKEYTILEIKDGKSMSSDVDRDENNGG